MKTKSRITHHASRIGFALCCLTFAVAAHAQFAAPIDTTTISTNAYTNSFTLLLPGVSTNAAIVQNTNYQIIGDLPATEAGKINTGFANAWTWAQAQSNTMNSIQAQITNGQVFYPSNVFNLLAITNSMPNFSFRAFNSNGAAWDVVFLSNGTPYIKQLFP